jgi:hypothetical protein
MPLPGEINRAIHRHGFIFLRKPLGAAENGPKWLVGGKMIRGNIRPKARTKKMSIVGSRGPWCSPPGA